MIALRDRLNRFMARLTDRRAVRLLPATRAVVSFCFDDFPASAEAGADILLREGLRGTLYLSTGRLGSVGPQGRIADEALVIRLKEAGHDIGCHTRSHLRADGTSRAVYRLDLMANAESLRSRFGIAAQSFAFPFGSVTPAAKAAAAALYRTSRTTVPGINRGRFDANLLRANPLYGTAVPEETAKLVHECRSHGGWLIFYTHDVCDKPSNFGCRADVLREVVRLVKSEGCDILPVCGVVDQRD